MDEALQSQLAVMTDEFRSAAIPDDCKQTVLWCLEQLPTLYTNFRKTNENRYGEEITRLVQAVVKELVQGKKSCPTAEQLAADIPERFRLLHEEWGLPGLALKAPRTPTPPRSRKVGSGPARK
jgi:hypothetical protein